MMRLLPLAATAVISFGAMAGVAAAQTAADCSLINTGANSNNVCKVENTNQIKVSCTNNTDVVFVNSQSANSGSVTLTGNTTSGYVYSGNSVNSNTTNGNLDVSCAPAQVANVNPTPSPSPISTPPQAPAPAPASTSAAPTVKAAVLPTTGTNPLVTTGITALALGMVVGISQLGTKLYKLFRP